MGAKKCIAVALFLLCGGAQAYDDTGAGNCAIANDWKFEEVFTSSTINTIPGIPTISEPVQNVITHNCFSTLGLCNAGKAQVPAGTTATALIFPTLTVQTVHFPLPCHQNN